MAVDDAGKRGEELAQEQPIAGMAHVSIDGVEEPQRGVSRVIEPFTFAFREHVGNQPVADVGGKRLEDVARLGVSSRQQSQAFEADHRVAAPVGEPVIAGDDRAGFAAAGARAGLVLNTMGPERRPNDELIGGEYELGSSA